MEIDQKPPIGPKTPKSKFEEYVEPLLVIFKCWILPMSNAELHYTTEHNPIKPDWLAIVIIAFLILAVLPELNNHTGQAALVLVLSASSALVLSFASKLAGKVVNTGVVINAYTSLAFCLFFFLIISQFNLLGPFGISPFDDGHGYLIISITSSIITFILWIIKSRYINKQIIKINDYILGGFVISLCGLITFLISDFDIQNFKNYAEFFSFFSN